MKAMLLAAGKGSRLGSSGLKTPKALMPVLGVPMLTRLLALLHRGGVKEGAINAHHLAWQLSDYLSSEQLPFPMHLFQERILLGSGGALMNAAHFWDKDSLLVWNADTISDVSLLHMKSAHQKTKALATLLVQDRPSQSYLVIDEEHHLCGLDSRRRQQHGLFKKPVGSTRNVAYNGIAILQPDMRDLFPPAGKTFDLIQALLTATSQGAVIDVFNPKGIFYAAIDNLARLKKLEDRLCANPRIRLAVSPYQKNT